MNAYLSLFRSIKRQKFVFLLNLFGLALGITAAYLMISWSIDEFVFDTFHTNYRNIFMVEILDKNLSKSRATPPPLGPALREEYPEIIRSTRYVYHSGGELLTSGSNKTYAKGIEVDTSFFEMFTFPVAEGEKENFFTKPNSILLTRELANRIFGKENPVGKTLLFKNEQLLVVRGVLADIPSQSSISFDYAVPYTTFYKGGGDEWGMWHPATFIQVSPQANLQQLAGKLQKFTRIHERKERELTLFALADIHFQVEDQNFFRHFTNPIHLQAILIMALFILTVSCLNYVNLSISLSTTRAREVGVKKVLGATKSVLAWQYLKEAFIQAFAAILLALAFLLFAGKAINSFAQKELVDIGNYTHILVFAALGMGVALLSGVYPSLFLSSFPPLSLIKKHTSSPKSNFTFRGLLIVCQFTVTIIVLVCSIILRNHMLYIEQKDLGYDKNYLIAIPMDRGDLGAKHEVIKQELAAIPNVQEISMSSFRYLYFDEKVDEWDGKKDDGFMRIYSLGADYNAEQTLGLTLQHGRAFSREFNEKFSLLINEEAARQMDMQAPVGKRVKWRNNLYTIVGVVKDFNYWSLSKKVEPVFIFQASWGDMYVRVNEASMTQTVSRIEKVFKKYNPAFPFEYRFMEQEVEAFYAKEKRMEKVFFFFTGICIFLSVLGLYALSSFVIREKMKEVAIKKILGASLPGLCAELSMLFLKWIFLACLLAIPIAIWGMNEWLSSYAYHRNIHWLDVVTALCITGVAATTALLANVLKASLTNPIQFIRAE